MRLQFLLVCFIHELVLELFDFEGRAAIGTAAVLFSVGIHILDALDTEAMHTTKLTGLDHDTHADRTILLETLRPTLIDRRHNLFWRHDLFLLLVAVTPLIAFPRLYLNSFSHL